MFETLQQDQKLRWQQGDRVPVAFYLKQYPELQRESQIVESLLVEEMRLRESNGESIDKDAYLRMYPEFRDAIEAFQPAFETIGSSLLPQHPSHLEPVTGTVKFEDNTVVQPDTDDEGTMLLDQNYDLDTYESPASSSPPITRTPLGNRASHYPSIPGFEIYEELGRGGMGIVYRAKQVAANRTVALKVVRNDQLDLMSPKDRDNVLGRFTTEAHAAASLQHDNIISIYEVGEAPSKTPGGIPLHYYAMRFVRGSSLFDLVRDGPLDNRHAAAYMQKVASALQAAHDHNILHRDMKPHNVMIEKESDRPLVADFGLAKIIDSGHTMTYAGQVMGTPSYMSPEQALDAGLVTAAADQYSIGATLYHILTGRPPFVASSAPETIRQILDKQPVSPRELNASVHRDLETICLKTLQKDPTRRYACCKDLADDLQRYLDGVPIVARPVSRVERTWRWCRRNPVMATMVGSVAFLALSTMAAITIGYRNTSAALSISESRLEKALQVVDELFTRVSEDDLLNEPGMQPLRRDLLAKALKHYEYFLAESGSDEKLANEIASAHYRVGMIQQVVGDLDSARKELELALEQQQSLWRQSPDKDERLQALSDTVNALGVLLDSQRLPEESLNMFKAAWKYRSQLAERHSENPEFQRRACNSLMNIAFLKIKCDQRQAGLDDLREAQNRRRSLLEKFPEERKLRRDLARGWYSLGKFEIEDNFEIQDNEANAAIEHFKMAIDEFRRLITQDSRSLSLRYDCCVALRLLGGIYVEHGDRTLATNTYEQAAELAKKLIDSNPDVADYKMEFAILSMNLASNYEESQQLEKAEEIWSQALRLEKELLASDLESPEIRADITTCLEALGDLATRREDTQSAKEFFDEALPMLRDLIQRYPNSNIIEKLRERLQHIEEQTEDLSSR